MMTARRHSPNLLAIRAVPDPEIQFYAILGACISLVSTVEHCLFECYVKASGLPEAGAAVDFFKYVSFKHKRNMADNAVRAAVAGDTQLLNRWDELLSRIQHLLGPTGARNLLAHNSVVYSVELCVDEGTGDISFEMPIKVSQGQAAVDANLRAARDETFESLYDYAQILVGICPTIRKFSDRVEKARAKSLAPNTP